MLWLWRMYFPVLTYDIWFYISHVMLHSKLLYPIHSIHHQKEEPQWMDTYLGHWLESPFQGIGTFVPYLFYTYTWQETMGILVFLNIRGMMRHDKRTAWLVDGGHHLEHHRRPLCNYGEVWIDWLCGTLASHFPVSHK